MDTRPRPPGQSALVDEPEISFNKDWGGLVRRARVAAKMTQTELGDAVGVKQGLISMIENGEIDASSAVMPIVRLLKIPPPKQYFSDAEEERWVEAGRVLRRINEPAFRGLLTAAEQMIANAEPKEH